MKLTDQKIKEIVEKIKNGYLNTDKDALDALGSKSGKTWCDEVADELSETELDEKQKDAIRTELETKLGNLAKQLEGKYSENLHKAYDEYERVALNKPDRDKLIKNSIGNVSIRLHDLGGGVGGLLRGLVDPTGTLTNIAVQGGKAAIGKARTGINNWRNGQSGDESDNENVRRKENEAAAGITSAMTNVIIKAVEANLILENFSALLNYENLSDTGKSNMVNLIASMSDILKFNYPGIAVDKEMDAAQAIRAQLVYRFLSGLDDGGYAASKDIYGRLIKAAHDYKLGKIENAINKVTGWSSQKMYNRIKFYLDAAVEVAIEAKGKTKGNEETSNAWNTLARSTAAILMGMISQEVEKVEMEDINELIKSIVDLETATQNVDVSDKVTRISKTFFEENFGGVELTPQECLQAVSAMVTNRTLLKAIFVSGLSMYTLSLHNEGKMLSALLNGKKDADSIVIKMVSFLKDAIADTSGIEVGDLSPRTTRIGKQYTLNALVNLHSTLTNLSESGIEENKKTEIISHILGHNDILSAIGDNLARIANGKEIELKEMPYEWINGTLGMGAFINIEHAGDDILKRLTVHSVAPLCMPPGDMQALALWRAARYIIPLSNTTKALRQYLERGLFTDDTALLNRTVSAHRECRRANDELDLMEGGCGVQDPFQGINASTLQDAANILTEMPEKTIERRLTFLGELIKSKLDSASSLLDIKKNSGWEKLWMTDEEYKSYSRALRDTQKSRR